MQALHAFLSFYPIRPGMRCCRCEGGKAGVVENLTECCRVWPVQMKTPFMYVTGIHFDALTDIAWSKDGQHLIATSKDGYCTMIEFTAGELGQPLDPDMLPPIVAKVKWHIRLLRVLQG